MNLKQAKERVRLWIEKERDNYASQKWEVDNADRQAEVIENGEWINFPFSYLKRAQGMGLDTLQGRQALGKVITSSTSLLERAVSMHGDMPKPGVSSTDGAIPWVDGDEALLASAYSVLNQISRLGYQLEEGFPDIETVKEALAVKLWPDEWLEEPDQRIEGT